MERFISDAVGRALSFSSDVSGRYYDLTYNPIIMIFGWVFIAYLIYILLAYVFYGNGYYYGRPYWGRNVPMAGAHMRHPNLNMRLGSGGVVGMNENDGTHLTAEVTRAVASPPGSK